MSGREGVQYWRDGVTTIFKLLDWSPPTRTQVIPSRSQYSNSTSYSILLLGLSMLITISLYAYIYKTWSLGSEKFAYNNDPNVGSLLSHLKQLKALKIYTCSVTGPKPEGPRANRDDSTVALACARRRGQTRVLAIVQYQIHPN